MKTKIIVIAPDIFIEPFELKGLKFIPRAGEYFGICEEQYPKQWAAIDTEEQRSDKCCRVLSVSNYFREKIHFIYIELDSGHIED